MEHIGGDSIYLSPFARPEMRHMSYTVYGRLISDPLLSGTSIAHAYSDKCAKFVVPELFNTQHLARTPDLPAGGTEDVNLGASL